MFTSYITVVVIKLCGFSTANFPDSLRMRGCDGEFMQTRNPSFEFYFNITVLILLNYLFFIVDMFIIFSSIFCIYNCMLAFPFINLFTAIFQKGVSSCDINVLAQSVTVFGHPYWIFEPENYNGITQYSIPSLQSSYYHNHKCTAACKDNEPVSESLIHNSLFCIKAHRLRYITTRGQ